MKKCFIHRWTKKKVHYDCSDICIWSSGFVTYRYCRKCERLEKLEEPFRGKPRFKEIERDSCFYESVVKKFFTQKR